MKQLILILFFPTVLFAQKTSLLFGQGVSGKKEVIGTVGLSFLMDNTVSDKYNFRIDVLTKTEGLNLGVENRFGVCTNRIYPFAFFNLAVKSNMGLGLMYRVPLYDNYFEIGGTVSTDGRYIIQSNVVLNF